MTIPIAPVTPPAARSAAQITMTSWNARTDSPFGANVSPTSDARDDDADQRDADQSRDAGDGVVDRRGDPCVVLVGVGEDGGGQRRDREREADREDEQRGEEVPEVRDVPPIRREQQDAAGRDERPGAHEQARAVAVGERADRRESANITIVTGRVVSPLFRAL